MKKTTTYKVHAYYGIYQHEVIKKNTVAEAIKVYRECCRLGAKQVTIDRIVKTKHLFGKPTVEITEIHSKGEV
jgi:hypothetical protein